MNYEKIYYNIINKALFEEKIGIRYKGNGLYYEKHHIIPHSLGGSNKETNLVLLTAKEHFICHWLLVKRYNQKTNERKKMLYAFHRMCYSNPNNDCERPNNSRSFEKYRLEFSLQIKKQNSKYIGDKNSQFGKHWYTNRDTGECKTFSESPNEKWVEGRNIFNGEYSIIATKHTVKNNKLIEEKIKVLWEECKQFKNVVEFCKHKKLCNSTICAYFRTYIVDYKK